MTRLTEELVAQVLELPEEDRISLAVRMLDSVEEDPSDVAVRSAWIEECRKRIAEIDAGLQCRPIEELWRKLDERRHARAHR